MANPETTLSEETIYHSTNLTITVRQVQLQSGQVIDRPINQTPGAVVIVPLTEKNEVRLIKQYRAAADKWLYELPAGTLNPGEDPTLAAPRELIEETGDQAELWDALGGFYTVPSIVDEYLHLYLARNLTPGKNSLDFDEHIEVVTFSWATVLTMISQGSIEDAKTISGIIKAGLYLNLPLTLNVD